MMFAVTKARAEAQAKITGKRTVKSLDDVEPLSFGKKQHKSGKNTNKKKLKSLDDVVPLNTDRKISHREKTSQHGKGHTSPKHAVPAVALSPNTPPVYKKAVPVVPANVTSNAVMQHNATTTHAPTNQSIQQAQTFFPVSVPAHPVPALVKNQEQMPIDELRKKANQGYYPGLPPEERVAKLLSDGCTNEQIAMRLDMSLKAVMDLRKQVRTKTLIQSPRDLFSSRLSDFNSAFDEALKLYNDTPDSEVSYKILVEFMKTMRELVKDYNDLEDPRELAQQIIGQALRPLVQSLLTVIVSGLKSTIKNVSPFLKEQERIMLVDSLTNGLRTLQDSVNGEYNNSVSTLEKIFSVELESMKAHTKSKDKLEAPVAEEAQNDVDNQPPDTV